MLTPRVRSSKPAPQHGPDNALTKQGSRTPVAQRLAPLAIGALLATCACGLYAGALSSPFFFDDQGAIVGNPQVRALWPLSEAMTAPPGAPTSHRPLVALSFALNYAFGGLEVEGYHVVNVCLHAINAWLVFGLVALLLRHPQLPQETRSASLQLAAATALLWSVHPLLSESVVYVTQRTELMAATLYFCALLCAARAFVEPQRRFWQLLVVCAAFAGLGCKETAATIAVAVLCLDRLAFSSSLKIALRARPTLYTGLALQLCTAAAMIVGAPSGHADISFSDGIGPLNWLATQAGVLALYLQRVMWPDPLSVSYEFPIAMNLLRYWPELVLTSSLLLATTWSALTARSARAGLATFPALLFFIYLAPTSSIVPLPGEVAAERRMYLPSLVLVAYIVLLGHTLLIRSRLASRTRRRVATALVCGVAGLLATRTVLRVQDYANPERIWRAAVAADPNDPQAILGLALVLQGGGRTAEARAIAAGVTQWRSEYPSARDWAARAQMVMGLCDEADGQPASALEHYNAVEPGSPELRAALVDGARVLLRLGRAPEAVSWLERALALSDGNALEHHNLGVALSWVGRHADAAEHFAKAFALNPSRPESLKALAASLRAQHKLSEATRVLQELVRRWPDSAKAYATLGEVSREQGHDEQALTAFASAISVGGETPQLQLERCRLLGRIGRVAQALAACEDAVRLAPNDPRVRSERDRVAARAGHGR